MPLKYNNIFFLGIGGIGMSALARYFLSKGKNVAGYDKTETELTTILQSEGADITFIDNITEVGKEFLSNQTLFVYTPAIPDDCNIKNTLIKKEYTLYKRADVLGFITNTQDNICVAGTHGKTTTTTILAHILYHSQYQLSAFLGGISSNYQSNFVQNSRSKKAPKLIVLEADEYDRSYLKLKPKMGIITGIKADHLDVYGEEKELRKSFEDFINLLGEENPLILHYSEKNDRINTLSYGLHGEAKVLNISINEDKQTFDYSYKNWEIKGIEFNLFGLHNIENTCSAITAALLKKVEPSVIKSALKSFTGIKRRMEYLVKGECTLIDDYAHHPDEINVAIESLRTIYPHKKLTVIFQPHLFSRTQDFIQEFATELAKVDELILMPIYPARELPIDGVTSEWLKSFIKNTALSIKNHAEILPYISALKPELLVLLGAGDIDKLRKPLIRILTNNE